MTRMLRRAVPASLAMGACLLGAATLVPAAGVAPAASAGMFAIGDGNATIGASVEFWGAQWWKLNAVSGGTAPASFKGYAVTVMPTGPCSGTFTFTADPGNSSDPPATVAPVIPVLVIDSATKSGPVISGHYSDVVNVTTDPGYGPAPGHNGTGTVLGSACSSGGPTT